MYYAIARIDIHDTGFDQAVEVTFNVNGKYYPATLTDPAEYPELEVLSVTYADVCIVDNLTNEHDEIIAKACWERIEELNQESQEDCLT